MDPNFLAWRGNELTYKSSYWLYWSILAFVFLLMIIAWVYKSKISGYLTNANTILFMKKRHFEIISGMAIILFTLLRVLFLELDDYPQKWEYIQLHFCRFFIVLAALCLIFDKKHYIKFYGLLSFMGGLIGILFADIGNSQAIIEVDKTYNPSRISPTNRYGLEWGYDSYFWWDFVFAHNFIMIISVFLFLSSGLKGKINKATLVFTTFTMISLTTLVYFANIIMYFYAPYAWKSNWFYLGNQGISTLGKYSHWPYSYVVLVPIGWVALILLTTFYCLQDKIKFEFSDKKLPKKAKIVASENWKYFKTQSNLK